MTDRELLELAAKAAGIESDGTMLGSTLSGGVILKDMAGYWNPLTDDGDALRLAVKLGLRVQMLPSAGGMARVERMVPAWADYIEPALGAPERAMRRAIVMIAAEIGRSL